MQLPMDPRGGKEWPGLKARHSYETLSKNHEAQPLAASHHALHTRPSRPRVKRSRWSCTRAIGVTAAPYGASRL